MSLVGRLPAGPLDIIGDVHGEIDALRPLLARLGYPPDGAHPEGRRLVFLGDLVDRGPESTAVLDLVIRLSSAGHAHCVLGNHELSLLRGLRKDGNDWFFDGNGEADRQRRRRQLRFLAGLPLVLERPGLRVVHACWNAHAIAAVREAGELDAARLHDTMARDASIDDPALLAQLRGEHTAYGRCLRDPDWRPVYLPALAAADVRYQMSNPVRVLTSGEEAESGKPFWASGRWRMLRRVAWWGRYRDPVPVIIGHYWRRWNEAAPLLDERFGPDIFAGVEPHQWMGPLRNVYCVDFSAGSRASERRSGQLSFAGRLAALRVPEWEVVHDEGERAMIGPPGGAV
ncbi:MAG: metallophosphoesterase [Chromatiales bacterium]|nr:metallophosphoesterase [Chromatiales bacterium]